MPRRDGDETGDETGDENKPPRRAMEMGRKRVQPSRRSVGATVHPIAGAPSDGYNYNYKFYNYKFLVVHREGCTT